ncbi:hypothetical protein B9Z55_016624 [Caenorhabditis nigoni]|uniref:Integrase catalytic domain-containing protein n=2 Tax=Caenorhabditis nigoni TaxID=1611254 RepID=A0A2G5T5H5_9PELO|nr:hypothetical protein B9Z55_016624 [Caenorhabditis nigoni]
MSGLIRTQIGLAKRRIKDALERIEELSTEAELIADETTEIYNDLVSICDIADILRVERDRILQLDAQWSQLCDTDPKERTIMQDYKKRLGDYLEEIRPVAEKLVLLEKLYTSARTIHQNKSKEPEEYPVFHLPTSTSMKKERLLESSDNVSTNTSALGQDSKTENSTLVSNAMGTATNTAMGTNSVTPATDLDLSQHSLNPTTPLQPQLLNNTPIVHNVTTTIPAYNLNPFQVTLPSIKLPMFNGDHLQFHSFMDIFNTLIGQQPMDDMAKFHYLVSSLEGEARTLIQFLPMTAANYPHALSILKDNYGNTFRTRHHLIRQLQDLHSVTHSKNTNEILGFWTKATVTLNQLKNIAAESDNTTTADIILRKLPRFYISKLFGSGQQPLYTASQLLDQIHRLIQTDQLISTVFDHSTREERTTTMAIQSKHPSSRHQHHQNKAGGFRGDGVQSNIPPKTPCVFCASPEHYHRHHDCPTYRTVNERQQRARQLRLCFKCLKQHDDYRSCPRVPRCRKCDGNHQTSFCKPRENVPHHGPPQAGNQRNQEAPRFQPHQNRPQHLTDQSRNAGQPFNQQQKFQPKPTMNQTVPNNFANRQQPNGTSFNPRGRGTTNAILTDATTDYTSESFTAMVTDSVQLYVNNEASEERPDTPNDEVIKIDEVQEEKVVKPVAMMTAQVHIDDKEGNPVLATVFFDSGSDRSFMSTEMAKKLDLQADSDQHLNLNTFANASSTSIDTRNFMVNFNSNNEKLCVQLTEIPFITTKINFVNLTDSVVPLLLESEQLQLPRLQSKPDILIGMDNMTRLLGETTSRLLPNGMTMHHTNFGIIVTGRETEPKLWGPDIDPFRSTAEIFTTQQNDSPLGILQISPTEEHHALRELLEKFWTLDTTGLAESTMNKDEEEAYKFFADTTTRGPDGRYIVRWPYRDTTNHLADNRFLASFRLQSTMKRLSKDENLGKQYNDIILDQLSRDFVEFVEDEKVADGDVVHYLSHHPVIKMTSKSTKVRIVFDASAHSKDSKSLNDVLHTGQSLLPMIPGVLLRIRCPPILISGDIEKAFLQLGLNLQDRDACRFLWQFPEESQPRCLRFKRVPFGVKTSPYLLNETIKHHLQQDGTEISKRMLRNVYVDNIFIGVSTQEEGQRSYKESKDVFQEAQMRLTQYFSNSPELNDYMNKEEGVKAEEDEQKILGVEWNIQSDRLRLKLPQPIKEQLTKRRILKSIATAYDPIGLLTPVILLGKLFFQKLWLRTMDWDSTLSGAEMTEWLSIEKKWFGNPVSIARTYFATPIMPTDVFELHIFSDASAAAYGAVAYLRRLSNKGNEAVVILSKSRVAPVKKNYSIPQLELLGLEKAASLGKFLLSEMDLNITKVFVWSDSLCSVDQLSTNKANSTFSRNRLRKIKEALPEGTFSHVPGKINPADLVSRGCSLEELRSSEIWWKGPSYLQQQEKLPIRESSLQQAMCHVAITQPDVMEPIIDVSRFNSFHKLLNVIMTILLFITRIRKTTSTLAEVREKAKLVIIRLAQSFSPPSDEIIQGLHLQLDNNIWYYDGRQPNQRVLYLPHGEIAKMFIMHVHMKFHHSSTLYTLAKLREEVWITKGVSTIKKTIRECLHCKRNAARPFYQPDFPPLPDIRLNWYKPFTNVGMDYCGPFKARCFSETRKYYMLIFTCLTSRFTAVELVTDMECRSLLNAVRRIAAQFGCPQLIYTDNAQQIKLLEKVVQEARNQQQRLLLPSSDLPSFKFIPALSPWSGGIYERVVGILKRCLVQAGTTRRLLEEDDLRTLLTEAVSIINDRPLTTTTSDMDDLTPLKPSDLVFPNKQRRSILNVEETMDTLPLPSTQASILEDWMRLSSLSQGFIARWNTEYLQMLRGRPQVEHNQNHLNQRNVPQVGDIVLIDESGKFGLKRVHWPLAKVVEVDSRSAKLFNSRTKKVVERPFRYIVPLEISSKTSITSADASKMTPQVSHMNKLTPTTTTADIDVVANRTRSKTSAPGLSSTTIIAISLLCIISTVSSLPIQNSTLPPPNQSPGPTGTTIEDVLDSINSFLNEVATRLGYTIILLGIAITLYCVSILLHISSMLSTIFGILGRLFRLFQKCVQRVIYQPFSRTNLASKKTLFMVVLVLYPHLMSCCNEVAHINSKEIVCYDKDDSHECVLNTVSIVNLRTMGSTSCLQFQMPQDQKEANNEVIFSLKIEAEAIIMSCNKHVIFYARDHKLEFEFSRRCDSAGSCSIDKCTQIQPDENIPELSNHAKDSPGYTSCTAGCGCINCGCFYCDPSCLFYRYYAKPTSTDLYEISRCATWTPSLRVKITLNENSTIVQDLLPGIKFQLPGANISITAINLDNPPMPVHHATFISAYDGESLKWQSFTQIHPSAPGVPTRGLVGELHCNTKSNAESFACKFDPALCRCVGFGTKVSCNCQESTISDFKKSNLLPFKGQHHRIDFDQKTKKIAIETTQDSLVALQVEAINATVNRRTTFTKCIATQVEPLQGCHSCQKAATTIISCQSKMPMQAQLMCPDFTTSLDCQPTARSNEIRVAISSAPKEVMEVNMSCNVSCGIITIVSIKGKLQYEESFSNGGNSMAQVYEKIADIPSILGSISRWFYEAVFEKILVVGVLVAVVFGIFFCARIYRSMLIPRVRVFRHIQKKFI